MSWHRHEKMAARAEHPAHLSKGRGVVIEVFDHVKSCDQVKRVLRKRQIGRLTQGNVDQASLAAVPHGFFVDVDALNLSKCGEVGQHRPGPATDVEDPTRSISAHVLVEDLQQNPSSPDEPPVDVLHLAVLGVILPLQVREPRPSLV
jgi:hypothetical protein